MDGLAPIDGWALLAIFAKAAGYAAALVAMGGPLFVATFRSAPGDVLRLARQLAVSAALLDKKEGHHYSFRAGSSEKVLSVH